MDDRQTTSSYGINCTLHFFCHCASRTQRRTGAAVVVRRKPYCLPKANGRAANSANTYTVTWVDGFFKFAICRIVALIVFFELWYWRPVFEWSKQTQYHILNPSSFRSAYCSVNAENIVALLKYASRATPLDLHVFYTHWFFYIL